MLFGLIRPVLTYSLEKDKESVNLFRSFGRNILRKIFGPVLEN